MSDQTQSPSAMVILYPSVWGQLTVGQTLYNSVQKQLIDVQKFIG